MVMLLPIALFGFACAISSSIGSNSGAVRGLNRVLGLINLICPGIALVCAIAGIQVGKDDIAMMLIVAVGAPFGVGWLLGSLMMHLWGRHRSSG